jgi:hypothetical protein
VRRRLHLTRRRPKRTVRRQRRAGRSLHLTRRRPKRTARRQRQAGRSLHVTPRGPQPAGVTSAPSGAASAPNTTTPATSGATSAPNGAESIPSGATAAPSGTASGHGASASASAASRMTTAPKGATAIQYHAHASVRHYAHHYTHYPRHYGTAYGRNPVAAVGRRGGRGCCRSGLTRRLSGLLLPTLPFLPRLLAVLTQLRSVPVPELRARSAPVVRSSKLTGRGAVIARPIYRPGVCADRLLRQASSSRSPDRSGNSYEVSGDVSVASASAMLSN